MKTVYKYLLSISDQQALHMPIGAQILHVGLDPNGTPALWALVDPGQPALAKQVVITGTGRQVPDGLIHLGSFLQDWAVWHVWEQL